MNLNMGNIILIGMMGSGKSTVGKLLAKQIGLHFVDLDQRIVEETGLTIPQIFESKGEAYFREVESSLLRSILTGTGVVLATGGGAVLRKENFQIMLEHGKVVALSATVDDILLRVGEDRNRPLLAGDARERIMTLMAERKDAYTSAHYTIDTSGKDPAQVSAEILMLCRA